MQKRYTNDFFIRRGMKVRDIMEEFSKAGFSARALGEALEVYHKMLQDKGCVKILSITGALVPAGMRNVFLEAINNKLIDIIVITGANLTHDLIESFGIRHEQGDAEADDVELAKKNINRIYDIYLPNKGYLVLEDKLQEILKKLPQKTFSPNKFLRELGKHVKDRRSIIRACFKNKVEIFCPSITDSILGFQVWMYSQDHKLQVNPQLDTRDFLDLVWKNKKYGLIILGGGVPKNFVNIMMQVSGKSLNYAIQITTDRPEYGGLSGAQLKEAKSWKKVAANALTADVVCDATIAFPLLVASLI